MKLKLLGLVIGAAVAAPTFADVTVYGKLNATVENVEDAAGDDAWEVRSNASRFGIKGDAELTDSLKAIYKLEWQVDISDESKEKNITSRNQYIGLAGGFGQLIVGRHDTPLKSSQGKVDLFGDLDGDIKHVMAGENRIDNIIMYSTPKLGEMVTLNLAIQPGEGKDDAGENDGLADAVSASAVFEMDAFYAALAVDSEVKGMDIVRLTGQYNGGMFGVGAIYQTAEESEEAAGENSQVDSAFVSAYVKVGSGQIEAQYGVSMPDADNSDDLAQVSLGYEHKLGKKTKAFAFVTNTDNDQDDWNAIGFGVEHKF